MDDPAYEWGLAQYGDIIGPWIFDDLQRLLNLLIWTDALDYAWTANGENNRLRGSGHCGYPDPADWALAKADAEASLWYSSLDGYWPHAYTEGSYMDPGPPGGPI